MIKKLADSFFIISSFGESGQDIKTGVSAIFIGSKIVFLSPFSSVDDPI